MRTLYDSTTAADIPANAQMVGGYVSGRYTWSAADWARFPHAVKVRIAVSANVNDGHVLDVEPGDATPAEAPGWVRMRRAAGVDPTIYCNQSQLSVIQAAFAAAGVPQPHYWVARYDNVPNIPAGCVAKQYINDPASGGHYDLSAVADYWPGVDPAPFTPITAKGLDPMSVIPYSLDYRADFDNVALPFEVGSNSRVVAEGWVSLLATFGDSNYEVICLKAGKVVAFKSGAPTVGVIKENTRVFFEFPDGADGLALRYKNLSPGARLGYSFPQIPKG